MGRDEWRAWLRAKMDEGGWTQQSLADETGISQPMIRKYLTLGSVPNAYSINALAHALNVRAKEILDQFPVE